MSAVNKSIQDKMTELDELVAWFNSDEFVLESAIDKFKQAEALATQIEADLVSMQNDIRIVKEKFDAEAA